MNAYVFQTFEVRTKSVHVFTNTLIITDANTHTIQCVKSGKLVEMFS